MIKRRNFLDTLASGSLMALAPLAVRAATAYRVVVVGGGMTGVTAAKYLRLWSGKTVEVTLVARRWWCSTPTPASSPRRRASATPSRR